MTSMVRASTGALQVPIEPESARSSGVPISWIAPFRYRGTSALVGVHPFGGFNMSGTDSKAGGPGYLLQFLQAKSISEKIG